MNLFSRQKNQLVYTSFKILSRITRINQGNHIHDYTLIKFQPQGFQNLSKLMCTFNLIFKKMKNILVFIFSFCFVISKAQDVGLDWVKTYGSTLNDNANIIRTDSKGNLYVAGTFTGTVDFDPGPGILNKVSNGGLDFYILKLDSAGNMLWVRTFGNTSNDNVEKAQIDKADNILLTGRFMNTIDFDPGVNVDLKTSNGFSDIYILKLDDLGNYLWAKTIGGPGSDVARGLSINTSNDVTIAGNFLNTVDFDPGPGVTTKSALMVDIYILQLDAAGNFKWVKTLEGPQNNSVQVNDLMFDKNNNILINASYRDSIDVDPGPNIQYLKDTVDPLQYNLFLLKLDPTGNYIWAKQFQNKSLNTVGISVISCDSVGNYYLGGLFIGDVDFDFGNTNYTISTIKSASYILKIDSNANFIWAKHMGGFSGMWPEIEAVLGIAIDVQNNVILCGSFKGQEDFDPGNGVFYLGDPTQISNSRGYIMQLDSTGNFNWAKNISDEPASASVNGIALSNLGKLYVSGSFSNNTDFNFNAGINNVMAAGDLDAFVLKIEPCQIFSSTDTVNSCGSYTWINGNTYTGSNYTATHMLSGIGGCDTIKTLHLSISPINTNVTLTGNVFSANATNATYQWVDCQNNFAPIIGETNQTFIPSSNGSYAVVISNGICTDTSTCYTLNTLSIDNNYKNSITVFPNPCSGNLFIQTNKPLTLRLYNMVGQLILTEKIKELEAVDLNKISKGIYLFELSDNFNVETRGKLLLK